MEDKCLRCGKCCHFYLNGEIKRCRHLVDTEDGKTTCSVYPTRLGRILGFDIRHRLKIQCSMRTQAHWDYPDCPYNDGRPLWTGVDSKKGQIPRRNK